MKKATREGIAKRKTLEQLKYYFWECGYANWETKAIRIINEREAASKNKPKNKPFKKVYLNKNDRYQAAKSERAAR